MKKVFTEIGWMVHNFVGHPCQQLLHMLSLFGLIKPIDRLGEWIHDATLPPHDHPDGQVDAKMPVDTNGKLRQILADLSPETRLQLKQRILDFKPTPVQGMEAAVSRVNIEEQQKRLVDLLDSLDK